MTDDADLGPNLARPRMDDSFADPALAADGLSSRSRSDPGSTGLASLAEAPPLVEPDIIVVDDEPDGVALSTASTTESPLMNDDGLQRVRLFELDLVDAPSLDSVIEAIFDRAVSDHPVPVVLTPNVDIVVHLSRNPDGVEAQLFREAQFCLPDGQPLVLFSRLFGRPLRARLAGSDLFARLWPLLVARGTKVVVVASSDSIADRLRAEHPQASVVVPPYFDPDDQASIDQVVDEILAAAEDAHGPEMVLVGIGHPKDARLIASLRRRWDPAIGPMPLSMGLGGSFALYLGLARRAPRWIQQISMEWFWRFLQEPRRLFWRYFVRDVAFLPLVWREFRTKRPFGGSNR